MRDEDWTVEKVLDPATSSTLLAQAPQGHLLRDALVKAYKNDDLSHTDRVQLARIAYELGRRARIMEEQHPRFRENVIV